MSFEVFVQAFEHGEARPLDDGTVRKVLGPNLRQDRSGSWMLEFSDGTSELNGLDEGSLMLSHIEGETAWDALVELARQTRAAIMPVGCPVFVLEEDLIEHLPEELREDVRVIASGADLLAALDG